MPGCWRNFEDLEENLSLIELEWILEMHYKAKREDQIFAANIQGIDLEKAEVDAKKKKVEQRAQARLYGDKAAAEMEWDELGIEFEIEE